LPYFTAVIARRGDRWSARDVAVDEVDDLTDLAHLLRLTADDEPALLFIEREDSWWAVVRIDGDEDPRVFVSDVTAADRSPYGRLLEMADSDAADEGSCGGDFDLLVDLGSSPEDLRQMCEDELLPMDALAAVAEAGGFAEVLDSLR
jgi:putative tRNA adenosine deaminase-associated protein